MKFYPNGTVPKQANMYFIYGDGGTGKTSLAKQFEGNKMLRQPCKVRFLASYFGFTVIPSYQLAKP